MIDWFLMVYKCQSSLTVRIWGCWNCSVNFGWCRRVREYTIWSRGIVTIGLQSTLPPFGSSNLFVLPSSCIVYQTEYIRNISRNNIDLNVNQYLKYTHNIIVLLCISINYGAEYIVFLKTNNKTTQNAM